MYSSGDSLVHVECEEGFKAVFDESEGNYTILCANDEQWLNPDMVKCQGKDILIQSPPKESMHFCLYQNPVWRV